jgi:hypothetical protein
MSGENINIYTFFKEVVIYSFSETPGIQDIDAGRWLGPASWRRWKPSQRWSDPLLKRADSQNLCIVSARSKDVAIHRNPIVALIE